MKAESKLQKLSADLLMLEDRGEYQAARDRIEEVLDIANLDQSLNRFSFELGSELLLRYGSILGFYGHINQISDSQEMSKSLLSSARERFLNLELPLKVAECENYIGLSHYRIGDFSDALKCFDSALALTSGSISRIHARSIVGKSLVLVISGRHEEALRFCSDNEAQVQATEEPFVLGCFNGNFGLALKNAGRTLEAIDKFEASRGYHKKSQHLIYLGIIENDLAQTYKLEKRYSAAIAAVNNAIEIYEILGDKSRKGSSIDTKAQIYFDEGNYEDALVCADESIEILKDGENTAFLTESYSTRAKILIYLDEVAPATLTLMKAIDLARANVGEAAAEKLANEFEILLRKKSVDNDSDLQMRSQLYDGDFELILPQVLANYEEYEVVRIKNSHLEEIGIQKNSLAVVVEEPIKRGDLVVLSEIQDDSIVCGFYDYFAGIVSISGINSETLLFKTEEVKVVGKIIGVGNSQPGKDGKIHVKPIEI